MDFEYRYILELDLQMFAKEGEGGEKTEEATPKKLEDVRKEGNVAKSREVVTAATLIALYLCLRFGMGFVGNGFLKCFHVFYELIPQIVDEGLTITNFNMLMRNTILATTIIIAPFLLAGLIVAFMSNYLQFKFQVTTKPLQPKFSKLNPINGFKRMFSLNSLMELLKSIIKIIFIGYIAYSILSAHMNDIFLIYDMSMQQSLSLMYEIVLELLLKVCVMFAVLAAADYIYQKWKFRDDNKMTKQEIKDEHKNSEGDPKIKGQQRQRMMQASQRRMMQAVPEADVVITNPTHFAVALSYKSGEHTAPVVVAKGTDFLAAKIKDLAKEHKVDIVENKPLARMLYYNVEVDSEIPPELYQAVAEVLAYVYQLHNKVG